MVCFDCGNAAEETWDDRCGDCFYVYTGGDLGSDDWWMRHTLVRDCTVYTEIRVMTHG